MRTYNGPLTSTAMGASMGNDGDTVLALPPMNRSAFGAGMSGLHERAAGDDAHKTCDGLLGRRAHGARPER